MTDDFYVGYQPRAPESLRRFLRPRVAALLAGAALLALVLVAGQHPFEVATFEFGMPRAFAGRLELVPAPTLLTDAGRRMLLVEQGKHGLSVDPALDGRRVGLMGALIYRDDQTMLEVVPDSLQASGAEAPAPPAAAQELGTQTLRGEIVDSKCFLGVMNPGHTKPHRDCAVRCLSGGIPAVLLVRDDQGASACYLLLSPEGRLIGRELLDKVAEPVEATGAVARYDNLLVLRVRPADIRRLD